MVFSGVQASRAKKECTISLELPRAFELSVSATMDKLIDHAIEQREALTCFATFELLLNKAKWALKDSRWWADLYKAKVSNEYVFVDNLPAA